MIFSVIREAYKKQFPLDQRVRFKRYLAHNFRGTQSLAFRSLLGSNMTALAACYGTDKYHNYMEVYMQLFSRLRKKRINILEIGIGGFEDPLAGGASLRMWRTYFPNSRIYGIDLHDKTPHNEKRIKTFQGSQDDESFLKRTADQIGRLDIIIDDGSHVCAHVIKSFEVLFPRLAPGGIYVVEDTHTSYSEEFGGSVTDPDSAQTMVGYFKKLVHAVNRETIQKLAGRSFSEIEKMISGISFYENIVVINKAD